MGAIKVPDYEKATWQTRQFDRNPGRGETPLTAVAKPSENALAAEAYSQERVESTVSYDENGNEVLTPLPNASTYPTDLSTRMTAQRDWYKDQYEQIGNAGKLKESELYNPEGKLLGHRDAYKDFYDAASILKPDEAETPEEPEEPETPPILALTCTTGDAVVEETSSGQWTVTLGEEPYKLSYGETEFTDEIALDATATTLRTALNALGDTVFTVTGSTGGPFTVKVSTP